MSATLAGAPLRDDLEAHGYAVVPRLFDADACAELVALFDDESAFRKTIVMERHGYGRGVYRYFRAPLPARVAAVRAQLYADLAPIANDWAERLGRTERYPNTLDAMLERCHAAGQQRPTPLLLRYDAGDYNALHQDTYGPIAFPLQATVVLSAVGSDFTGGEFTLVEGRARRQSLPHVVPLDRGDAVIFPNQYKPNARGGRSTFRHGVSVVRSGRRLTLGVIFHDAL